MKDSYELYEGLDLPSASVFIFSGMLVCLESIDYCQAQNEISFPVPNPFVVDIRSGACC